MKKRDPEHQKELEQHAPFLAKHEAPEGFNVPEGYFDQLPDQLWNAVQADQGTRQRPRVIQMRTLRAIAAAVVLLFAVGFWIYNQPASDQSSPQLASIDHTELENVYSVEETESGDFELILFPEIEEDDPIDDIFAELEQEDWDEWF